MTKIRQNSSWRENIEAIIIAVIIAMFIRTFMVQAFKIPSGSMMNTLLIGDHILVSKFVYGVDIPYTHGKTLLPFKNPKRGDIVVFKYPKDPTKDYIKRVVAVGGDTVEIVDKRLRVNNEFIDDEPYAVFQEPHRFLPKRDNMPKRTIPENCLFVMGDNRDNSHDSRWWGYVNLDAVRGKAFIIYWSWDSEAISPRWGRLGNLLK
ncbi:MAG: signal peptidase I [Desulfobacteraceae bacterium]|nr:signal peptidase I [Desulfobacteraceae bacterium]